MKINLGIILLILCCTFTSKAQITGTLFVCQGSTTALSHGTPGGTWTSTTTGVATIGSSSGVVSGVAAGTSIISYVVGGSTVTATVTVGSTPGAIQSTNTTICVSASGRLVNFSPFGTWSSSNTGIATIGSATGLITGVATGTATASYTFSNGCYATTTITVPVELTANAIATGNGSFPLPKVCELSTIQLTTDATSGGTWGSTNTAVATINSSTGVMTGGTLSPIADATTNIQYINGSGCVTTVATVTVLPRLASPTHLCQGSTTTVTITPTTDGTWDVTEAGRVTLDPDDLDPNKVYVTADNPGVFKLRYIRTNTYYCANNISVSPISLFVVANEGSIRGVNGVTFYPPGPGNTLKVCVNEPAMLNAMAVFGTYSTSPSLGGSQVFSGNYDYYSFTAGATAGTSVVTYTTANNVCTAYVNVEIVDPSGPITGTATVCTGKTTTLSHTISGGTWISSNASIATVGSATGIVTGVAAGTATISYRVSFNSCYITKVVTVNTSPAAITGTLTVCAGATTSLNNATGGGTWSSSNASVATVGTSGVVTGVAAGTATITYTVANGCFGTATVTVNSVLAEPYYDAVVCESGTLHLYAGDAGGNTYAWTGPNSFTSTSRNPVISSVSSAAGGIYSLTVTSGSCSTNYTLSVAIGGAYTLSVDQTAPFLVVGDNVHTYSSDGFTLLVNTSPSLPETGVTYTWTGEVPGSTASFSPTFTPTNVTTIKPYTVTVAYNGCSVSIPDTIIVPGTTVCNPYTYFSVNGYRATKELGEVDGCTDCDDVQPFHTITSPTLSAANVTDGQNYYVPFSVVCEKSVLTDNNFFMGDSTYIRIDSGSSVEIEHCHFFSCKWIGIIVNQGDDTTTHLKVTGNTLIENATESISDDFGLGNFAECSGIIVWPNANGRYFTGMPDILESDGAIYNRNTFGIQIFDYQPSLDVAPAGTKLPFTIRNNVFTSKEWAYNDTGTISAHNYPFAWPSVATLKTVTAYSVIPTYGVNAYRRVAGGFAGVMGYFVGSAQQLTAGDDVTPATYAYNYLEVGDATADPDSSNSNLTDSLMYGFSFASTNVKLYNNRFRNVFFSTVRFLHNTGDTTSIHDCRAEGIPADNTNNRFYNCSSVFSVAPNTNIDAVWDMTIRNVYTHSVIGVTGMNPPGHATHIQLYGQHNALQIYDNEFHKSGGIVCTYNINANLKGYTRISRNIIDYKTDAAMSTITRDGIYVSDYGDDTVDQNATLHIDSNQITGFAVGIYLDAVEQSTYVNDNKIKVFPKPSALHSGWINGQCVGMVVNGWGAREVKRNHITGIGYNCTQYDADPLRGMSFFGSGSRVQKVAVHCNLLEDINHGITFIDTCNVDLRNNEMRRNNIGIYFTGQSVPRYGYIGAQGGTGDPSDNRWTETGGTETYDCGSTGTFSWTGSNYTTYTNFTYATGSPFYVRSGAPYEPTNNTHAGGVNSNAYATGNGSLVIDNTGSASDCGPTYAARGTGEEAQDNSMTNVIGSNMQLFPNPTEGSISVAFTNASEGQVDIKVINAVGAVVYNGSHTLANGRTSLSLKGATSGMYILRLTDRKGMVSTGRITIVK